MTRRNSFASLFLARRRPAGFLEFLEPERHFGRPVGVERQSLACPTPILALWKTLHFSTLASAKRQRVLCLIERIRANRAKSAESLATLSRLTGVPLPPGNDDVLDEAERSLRAR